MRVFIRLSTTSLTLATDILGFIPQFEARPLADVPAIGLFSYIKRTAAVR